MKPVRAEFVRRAGPPPAVWWGVGVLAATLLGLMLDSQRLESAAIEQRQMAALEARATELAASKASPETISVEQVQRQAFRKLRDVDWPQALAALEKTPRGALQVEGMQVEVGSHTVNLQARATDPSAVVTYVAALNAGLIDGELGWRWAPRGVQLRAQDGGYRVEIVGTWGRSH